MVFWNLQPIDMGKQHYVCVMPNVYLNVLHMSSISLVYWYLLLQVKVHFYL